MRRIKTLVVMGLLAVFSFGAFTGCNTARGFGEDLESAGEGIQEGVE